MYIHSTKYRCSGGSDLWPEKQGVAVNVPGKIHLKLKPQQIVVTNCFNAFIHIPVCG